MRCYGLATSHGDGVFVTLRSTDKDAVIVAAAHRMFEMLNGVGLLPVKQTLKDDEVLPVR